MKASLCPALLAGHAASMSQSSAKPVDCMPRVIEASACLGSRCAKWVPEMRTPKGNRPGGIGPRAGGTHEDMFVTNDNGQTYASGAEPTGRGWCSDNLRRAPFADPAVGGAK